MIASEIATRIKRQFGDESSVQVQDADIMRWINDAQLEIANVNALLETVATANIVTGQAEYSMPDNILTLRSVRAYGAKLRGMSMQEAEEYIPFFDDPSLQETGNSVSFWVWANKINLYPIPNSSITGGLKLYYTRRPVAVTTMDDSLELAPEYHNRVVEYCLQQAYELDEDWAAAGNKAAQFTQGMNNMINEEKWVDRTYYPSITVLPEDF